MHLDSSSFHLHGQYEVSEPNLEAITITHGYSRDHRPDLKQVIVQLITSQRSALPVWLEVLSGNSSDKETFPHSSEQSIQSQAPHGPARFFVQPDLARFLSLFTGQLLWFVVLGLTVALLYRKSVSWLTINGG